jgi:RNA binding exosome subunit
MLEISGETTAGWFGNRVGVVSVDVSRASDDPFNAGAASTTPQANNRPARRAKMSKLIRREYDMVIASID